MATGVQTHFLRDITHGGSPTQLVDTARALADYITVATSSIDIAIYDFRLTDPSVAEIVVGALTTAADNGVAVRIGYDSGKPAIAGADTFAALEADPAPAGTAEWVTEHFAGTQVAIKAINPGSHLMHSKYVVRDAQHPGTAAVWTGSTNFTDDAWSRQENNIIVVPGRAIATGFQSDFDDMWSTGSIAGSGKHAGNSKTVGWDFSPTDGKAIEAALVQRISSATSAIQIAAMVLTSHPILAALSAAIDRGIRVTGIYDSGQMDPIVSRWKRSDSDADVIRDWTAVSRHLSHKRSTPYSPTSVHDFMHLKVMVIDDVVVTGSYNFSANAQKNAENQLHVSNKNTVSAYSEFLTAIIRRYHSR